MNNLCIVCNSNKAYAHPQYGILPCNDCTKAQKTPLTTPHEFVPESVKEERKKNAKDILQSSRGGILNKAFLDEYGHKGLKVTPEEIKAARYVYDGELESRPYKEPDGRII